MPKACWGIDVSQIALKAVRIAQTKGGIELTHLDVADFGGPTGEPLPDPDGQITEGLRLLASRNRLKGDTLAFSLPGHATFNRFIKIPPVGEKRLAEIVRYEAQQHIPFPIEEVIWDFQALQREYQPGEEMEVVIFAVKKDVVGRFLASVASAGLQIDMIQFAPVAQYNFMKYDQDLGLCSVILDMGADNTDLIIVEGDKFWIRNLPRAGNDITRALQKKFQIPFQEAEKLKINAAQSQQAAKIFGVIQPELRDLCAEVQRSVGYYKSLSRTAKFEKIVLVGGATRTVNLQKFMAQNLQMEAVLLSKLNKVGISNRVPEAQLQKHLPSLGVAFGLALQGIEVSPNRVNLVPPEIVRLKKVAQKRPFAAASVACFAAVVAFAYFRLSSQENTVRQARERAENILQQAKTSSDLFRTSREKFDAALQDPQNYAKFIPERTLFVRFLEALTKELPDNAVEIFDSATGNIHTGGTSPDQRIWLQMVDGREVNEIPTQPPVAKEALQLTVHCGIVARVKQGTVDMPDMFAFVGGLADKIRDRLQGEGIKVEHIVPTPLEQEPVAVLEAAKGGPDLGGDLLGTRRTMAGKAGSLRKYMRFRVDFYLPTREKFEAAPAEQPSPQAPSAGAG